LNFSYGSCLIFPSLQSCKMLFFIYFDIIESKFCLIGLDITITSLVQSILFSDQLKTECLSMWTHYYIKIIATLYFYTLLWDLNSNSCLKDLNKTVKHPSDLKKLPLQVYFALLYRKEEEISTSHASLYITVIGEPLALGILMIYNNIKHIYGSIDNLAVNPIDSNIFIILYFLCHTSLQAENKITQIRGTRAHTTISNLVSFVRLADNAHMKWRRQHLR
ncbi:hypothetical protein ACJX0J_025937, partial [Zea mays]